MAEAAETSFDSVLVDSSNNLIATTIPSNSTARIQMPRIVTPLVEKKLTTSEFNTLQEALNTQKIAEITKAVLSIESLTGDIKKSMFPKPTVKSKSAVKRPRIVAAQSSSNAASAVASAESNSQDGSATSGTFVVKKRAPRAPPKEPRKPWKPERLDPTKPILQCDACGYQANRRDYMRRHQIRVHSDYRPYQCNLCDFKTTEKHDLDRHLASKYHGGKGITQKRTKLVATVRIKCDQCNYSSKSVQGILRHKQSHRMDLSRKPTASLPQAEEEEEQQEIIDFENHMYEETHVTMETQQHQGGGDEVETMPDTVTVLMMEDLIETQQQQ